MRHHSLVTAAILAAAWGLNLGSAHAALIDQPLPLDPALNVHMEEVDIAPAVGPLTTVGRPGHRHPGATYVYVLQGAVISRLGDAPEQRYERGQAWAETPGQPHYIVDASATEPARLLVVFVTPNGAARLTEPLSPPSAAGRPR